MRKFRLIAVVVATAFAFGADLARATDTPAQAAARAALQQQMNQMETEQAPGSTNSMTPPATPSAPAPAAPSTPPPAVSSTPPSAAQPPSVTMPTPQFSTNVPVNPETETEMAPAKMSQTNEPATAEMNTRTKLPAITVPPSSVLMTNQAEQYPVNPPLAPLPPAQGEPSSQPPTATMPVSTGAQLPPADANGQQPPGVNLNREPRTTNSVPSFESISAPPLPISQQQQAELQNLLSRYMANQVTPAQYQQERAQIIGQQ